MRGGNQINNYLQNTYEIKTGVTHPNPIITRGNRGAEVVPSVYGLGPDGEDLRDL